VDNARSPNGDLAVLPGEVVDPAGRVGASEGRDGLVTACQRNAPVGGGHAARSFHSGLPAARRPLLRSCVFNRPRWLGLLRYVGPKHTAPCPVACPCQVQSVERKALSQVSLFVGKCWPKVKILGLLLPGHLGEHRVCSRDARAPAAAARHDALDVELGIGSRCVNSLQDGLYIGSNLTGAYLSVRSFVPLRRNTAFGSLMAVWVLAKT